MIARDGFTVSLWQSLAEPYQTKHQSGVKKKFDVIIAGGGMTGLTTALLLQKAGKRCLVLEAHNIGFGTTGGTTAHLNTLLDVPYTTIAKNFGKENAQLVAQSAAGAIAQIRSHIRDYRMNCDFSEAEAYLFATDEKQHKELEQIIQATTEAGVDMQWTDSVPVPVPFLSAAAAKGQAKFNPLRYLYALAEAFEQTGGVVLQHTAVRALEDTGPVNVTTDVGVFECDDFIYATHIPPGVNLLHLRCIPYRSYAMSIRLADNNYPQGLSYDMLDPYHYYRTQIVDGASYLIAGGKDHKTGHEDNTSKCFLQLEAHLRQYFTIEEVTHKWSSQYFEPADGLPYIGQLPGSPEHIYVATGFGGNGMIYSHVAAQLFTDILTAQTTPYQKLFDPNRVKPIAGFSNFLQHNADTLKQFIGKLLPSEKLNELAGIATDEGKVVKYEDQKLAIYKDEHHNMHVVHPVCTHLKCDVQWNHAERSWDCPCHGARYNTEGKVLTGPADKDLEKVTME